MKILVVVIAFLASCTSDDTTAAVSRMTPKLSLALKAQPRTVCGWAICHPCECHTGVSGIEVCDCEPNPQEDLLCDEECGDNNNAGFCNPPSNFDPMVGCHCGDLDRGECIRQCYPLASVACSIGRIP